MFKGNCLSLFLLVISIFLVMGRLPVAASTGANSSCSGALNDFNREYLEAVRAAGLPDWIAMKPYYKRMDFSTWQFQDEADLNVLERRLADFRTVLAGYYYYDSFGRRLSVFEFQKIKDQYEEIKQKLIEERTRSSHQSEKEPK